MFVVCLGVTELALALFWERNSWCLWKTSVAFPLCAAQFCQERCRGAPGMIAPNKMQLVSVHAGVGIPEDVTSIHVERGGI